MLKVDARGDACPLPVVKAKKAIAELNGAGEVEVLVDLSLIHISEPTRH